jgi:hypothetical protein
MRPRLASLRTLAPLALLAAALVAPACNTQLEQIANNICGNGVIDPGEDCDFFPADGKGDGCVAPGQPLQCRYTCATDADCAPHGQEFRCAASAGVCRRPSGRFQASSAVLDVQPNALTTADFDGDGHADLVAISDHQTLLAHFDNGGAPTIDFTLSASLPFGCIGDLSADGLADAAFPVARGDGIDVVLGTSAHGFLQQAYPAITATSDVVKSITTRVAGAIYAHPAKGDPNAATQVLLYDADDTFTGLGRSRHPNDVLKDGFLTFSLLDATGARVHDNIGLFQLSLADTASSCPAVLTGFRGDSHLWLARPCEVGTLKLAPVVAKNVGTLLPPTQIPLPGSLEAGSRILPIDLDQDGFEDLLVGTIGGSIYAIPYEPLATPPSFGQPLLFASKGPPFEAGSAKMPLAVGGRVAGRIEVVTQSAIWSCVLPSQAPAVYSALDCDQLVTSNNSWTAASIADFNGNGFGDVVAGSSDPKSTGLDFFNGTATGYNPTFISTGAPVGNFATGDFDGDLLPDLAFGSLADSAYGKDNMKRGDGLHVLFGKPLSYPDTVLDYGVAPHFVQIQPTNAYDGDTIDDLYFVSAVDDSGHELDSIAELSGRADRLLVAPLRPTIGNADALLTTVGVAQGDFDGDGHGDLAAVGNSAGKEDAFVVLIRMTDSALLDSFKSTPLLGFKAPSDPNMQVPSLPDAKDAPWRQRAADLSLVSARLRESGAADDLILVGDKYVRLFTVTDKAFGDPAIVTLQSPIAPRLRVLASDVDSDHHIDLVVPHADGLEVLWGRGDGSFENESSTLTLDHNLQDVKAIRAFGASLAVLVNDEVHLVTKKGRVLSDGGPLAGVSIRGAHAIATGDFDGDAIDDLALGAQGGTYLFFGIPVAR